MEEKILMETVGIFVQLCDKLLSQGKISVNQYHEFTRIKKEFLKNRKAII